jgi:carboxypeptidase D
MRRLISSVSVLLLILFASASHSPTLAAGRGEPGPYFQVRVELSDRAADLRLLQDLDIDIETVRDGWARLHLIEEEIDKLEHLGFQLTMLPDDGKIGLARMQQEGIAKDVGSKVPALYHTYATLTSDLATIAADHPDITNLVSIGLSVQGREMWMMEITDNPDVEEDEPEIHYISSMHGDEVVGKELCFNLINYLTDNYGTDPRVTDLVDNAEIRIMPSMNPDGTELGQRYNANGYDLNRNFPDEFVDPNNTTVGRQPEVANVMNWVLGRRPIISMNYHCGVLVANYPRDSNPAGASVFSPTDDPDHDAFVMLARTYADNNPALFASNSHPSFDNGICNGADWYSINGGMQDWFYVWSGGWDITLEVSNQDWPPASTLPGFWDDNLESMLSYFERSLEGLRGVVTDADTGLPLDAEIYIDDNPYPSYTDPDVGDYHRMILPGTYTVEVTADGHDPMTFPGVVVSAGPATVFDVELGTLSARLRYEESRVEDGVGGNDHLDPGESADIAVTLRNIGGPATAVSGTLEPTGWSAGISRPQAAFPDINAGQMSESTPPHFGVDVSPSAPNGHKAGFVVNWHSGAASGTTAPFFLDVGEPSCDTVEATDVPQTVSAILSAHSEVEAVARKITDILVPVDIQHTYIGDLRVTLSSPSGTSILLHDRTGGSSDNIVGTYGDDLIPAESLDIFLNEQAEGTWTLDITDAELFGNGSLEGWSLELCGYADILPPPEMRFSEFVKQLPDVQLEWWPYPGLTSYRVYRSTDPSDVAAFIDVTPEDGDDGDTRFLDGSDEPIAFFLVTGVNPQGEGPKGHFGE